MQINILFTNLLVLFVISLFSIAAEGLSDESISTARNVTKRIFQKFSNVHAKFWDYCLENDFEFTPEYVKSFEYIVIPEQLFMKNGAFVRDLQANANNASTESRTRSFLHFAKKCFPANITHGENLALMWQQNDRFLSTLSIQMLCSGIVIEAPTLDCIHSLAEFSTSVGSLKQKIEIVSYSMPFSTLSLLEPVVQNLHVNLESSPFFQTFPLPPSNSVAFPRLSAFASVFSAIRNIKQLTVPIAGDESLRFVSQVLKSVRFDDERPCVITELVIKFKAHDISANAAQAYNADSPGKFFKAPVTKKTCKEFVNSLKHCPSLKSLVIYQVPSELVSVINKGRLFTNIRSIVFRDSKGFNQINRVLSTLSSLRRPIELLEMGTSNKEVAGNALATACLQFQSVKHLIFGIGDEKSLKFLISWVSTSLRQAAIKRLEIRLLESAPIELVSDEAWQVLAYAIRMNLKRHCTSIILRDMRMRSDKRTFKSLVQPYLSQALRNETWQFPLELLGMLHGNVLGMVKLSTGDAFSMYFQVIPQSFKFSVDSHSH